MTESSPFKNDLEAILEQAMAMEAGARRPFLEARLAQDQAALEEALALLKVVTQSERFLEKPLISYMAEATQSATQTLEEELEALPEYNLVECLGEGGMGKVYRAEQIQPVQRAVALKVMKIHPLDRRRAANFQHEYRALGQMEHPNVARLYQAGTTQSGFPFFTMELVRGMSLKKYLKTFEPSQKRRLEHFLDICAGVAHAHQKGIIHRDIKPSNVLVAQPENDPTIKLIDFGVARALEMDSTALMANGDTDKQVLGTLAYMSPEQIRGEPDDVRVDVYGLGCLLYEMLTGEPAYTVSTSGATSRSEMVAQVLRESPLPPSQKCVITKSGSRRVDSQKLPWTYQRDLDAIVLKAMAKDRDRRYASVFQLAEDVRCVLEKRPVLAQPATAGYRFARWLARHRIQAIVWAIVFLALAAGFAGAFWGLIRARAAQNLAEQKRLQAEMSRRDLDMAMNYLESVIAATHPGKNPADAPIATILDEAYEGTKASLPDNPAIRARVFFILAEAQMSLGQFGKAEVLYGEALRESEQANGPDHPRTLSALIGRGWARTELDRIALALGDFEQAMQLACPGNYDWLRAKMGVADIERLEGNLDRAVQDYQAVLAGYLDVPDLDPRNKHSVLKALALVLMANGKAASAENILETVWDEQAKAAGAFDLEAMLTYTELGRAAIVQGRFGEAIRMLKPALVVLAEDLGTTHERTLDLTQDLMLCASRLGELDLAESFAKTLVEGRRETLGEFHKETLTASMSLGVIYGQKGNTDQAIAQLGMVYGVRLKQLGPDHRDTLGTANNLGNHLLNAGRLDEAENLLRTTLDHQTRILGAGHPDTLNTMCTLGETLLEKGQLDAALTLFETLNQMAQGLPERGFYRNYYHWYHGMVLVRLGRFDEAEPILLEAFEKAGKPENYRDGLVDFYRKWGKPGKAAAFEK